MSTSRIGPVLVAKSPSLEHQIASMSISGAAASSSASASTSASAPQPLAFSSSVSSFFERQRRLGAQVQRKPYPMKYDISIYRIADGAGADKCLATVDSHNCRKRELSIRSTDTAIDLIDEVLRKTFLQAVKEDFQEVKKNPSLLNDKSKYHTDTTFHTCDIKDFDLANPKETKSEHARFICNLSSKSVVLVISHEKISGIAERVLSFLTCGVSESPGPVFYLDNIRRVSNLISNRYQPELECLLWLMNTPPIPRVKHSGVEDPFSYDSLCSGLSSEIARRVLKSGMDLHLVDALIESYVTDERIQAKKSKIISRILETIETGQKSVGLTW